MCIKNIYKYIYIYTYIQIHLSDCLLKWLDKQIKHNPSTLSKKHNFNCQITIIVRVIWPSKCNIHTATGFWTTTCQNLKHPKGFCCAYTLPYGTNKCKPTPWINILNPKNGGLVQMILPFQLGDFLGSSS